MGFFDRCKRELCQLLMHDERLSGYFAWVQILLDTVVFYPKDEGGRRSMHLGVTVDLRFEDPAGCAVFKLAFIDRDEFIPWQNQG